MGLWSVTLICFYHLSWSVQADRQQPRIAVRPLDSLCLSSQVWRTIFSCLSGSTDVCNVFHLLFIISFHILSGFALKKCYLADVSLCVFGCFGVDLRGCFYFLSKRESSRLLQAFCSTRSDCPDVREWKTVFVRLFSDTWKNEGFYKLQWHCIEGKVFDNRNLNWFSLDKKSSDCYV